MKIRKRLIVITVCCILPTVMSGCAQPGPADNEYVQITENDSASQGTTTDFYEAFFAQETVHDLNVSIHEEDWEAITEDPEAEVYYSAVITIDGETIENVGFRTRGNSSLRMAQRYRSQRYPFRLKFDEYVEDQRFLGLDELVLTNSSDDPSYLREYLGYEAFRQLGMTVPLVTFFNLYINGELHGLYIGVEAIDNQFLNRAFGGHDGNLYKADLQATLLPDMDLALLEQKKGDDESKTDLTDLIRILNEMPAGEKGEIETVLNVNSVLQYFAGNAVIHNWDDYAGRFCHNYYFYQQEGMFYMIPWDMNESFLQTQAYYQPSDGASQDIATPITGDAVIEERPLVEKLLAVPEYYQQYLMYCDQLREWLESMPDMLAGLYERIADSAAADPTGFYGAEEFDLQFDSGNPDGLAGFVTERAVYLADRLPELLNTVQQ